MIEAARGGHLEILEWATANGCRGDRYEIYLLAAREGLLGVLAWAEGLDVDNCSLWDSQPLGPDVCAEAAKGGKLKALMWLRENGCPWDEKTCEISVECSYARLANWAREKWQSLGLKRDDITDTHRSSRWLRENGCPWDEENSTFTLMKDHMEVLGWARASQGEGHIPCPWSDKTRLRAAILVYVEDKD